MCWGDVYRANTTLVSHTPNLPVSSHTSHANSGLRLSLELQSLCRATSACLCVSLFLIHSLPPTSSSRDADYSIPGYRERTHTRTFLDGRWQVNNQFQQQWWLITQSEVSPTHTHTHKAPVSPLITPSHHRHNNNSLFVSHNTAAQEPLLKHMCPKRPHTHTFCQLWCVLQRPGSLHSWAEILREGLGVKERPLMSVKERDAPTMLESARGRRC